MKGPIVYAAAFAFAFALAPLAHALDIKLPPETSIYKPSDLPGYRLVQQNCLTCHAAQYVQFQPPSSPRGYWDATAKKMKNPFGAPFAEEDIPAMVDYLVRTYGAERGVQGAPSIAAASPPSVTLDATALLAANGCNACHAVDKKIVGPACRDVASKYAGKPGALGQVKQSIRMGGAGKWGEVPMPPFPQLGEGELNALASWILAH